MNQGPVQSEAEIADFAGGLSSPRLGRGISSRSQRCNYPFHEPELTLGGCLERPEVPWFQTMAFQLDARPRHLEGVFVKLSAYMADQPETQQRFEERHAGTGLGTQLLLSEGTGTPLHFSCHFSGDHTGRHRDTWRKVLRPLAAINSVQVVLDDFQWQVLIPLEGQDKTEPLNIAVGVLTVTGRSPLGIDESFFLKEADFGRCHPRKVVTQLSEDLPYVQDLWSSPILLGHSHRQIPRQTWPAARTGLR